MNDEIIKDGNDFMVICDERMRVTEDTIRNLTKAVTTISEMNKLLHEKILVVETKVNLLRKEIK